MKHNKQQLSTAGWMLSIVMDDYPFHEFDDFIASGNFELDAQAILERTSTIAHASAAIMEIASCLQDEERSQGELDRLVKLIHASHFVNKRTGDLYYEEKIRDFDFWKFAEEWLNDQLSIDVDPATIPHSDTGRLIQELNELRDDVAFVGNPSGFLTDGVPKLLNVRVLRITELAKRVFHSDFSLYDGLEVRSVDHNALLDAGYLVEFGTPFSNGELETVTIVHPKGRIVVGG